MATASDILSQLERTFEERHGYAREWQARTGGQVLGFFCTYSPEEIIYAAGMLPVRIFGSHQVQDLTDKHIFPVWCPYCRDCLYEGLTGKYDYLVGVVNTWCCMHMRGAYISWWRRVKSMSYHHEIYWPIPLYTEAAEVVATKGFDRFRKTLEELTGKAITPQGLARAAEVFNTDRRLMRQVYEMRKRPHPPLSGAQAMAMVLSSQVMDKGEHAQLVAQALRELETSPGRPDPGPRLMIIGSENDDRALVRFIESLGATVVIDDQCTGSKYIWEDVFLNGDPVAALARRYINKPVCPQRDVASPGRRHLPYVLKLAQEWGVQGVVFLQQKFCDPHLWDFPIVDRAVKEKGLPTLWLEVDVTTPVGQFRTRLEAFLETLQLEGA